MPLRSFMAGCFSGAPVCDSNWHIGRLRGHPRRVGVATQSPRSNQKKPKGQNRRQRGGNEVQDGNPDTSREIVVPSEKGHAHESSPVTRERSTATRVPAPDVSQKIPCRSTNLSHKSPCHPSPQKQMGTPAQLREPTRTPLLYSRPLTRSPRKTPEGATRENGGENAVFLLLGSLATGSPLSS